MGGAVAHGHAPAGGGKHGNIVFVVPQGHHLGQGNVIVFCQGGHAGGLIHPGGDYFDVVIAGLGEGDAGNLFQPFPQRVPLGAFAEVLLCREYCTDNISLDLMYGLEGQTMDGWIRSVEDIVSLEPAHISCYALTLEESTPMAQRRPVLPDDDTVADMYLAAVDRLGELGFEQYEISNFCRRGYRSAHNSRYWDLRPYIGIGAAAHSFFGDKRYSTIRDVDGYISGILSGESVIDEADEIAVKNRIGEYIMLRLRTIDGIDESDFERRFRTPFDSYAEKLKKYVPTAHAECGGGIYRLTPKGFFISNTIICDVLDI